jgi:hypothetical protein
MPLDTKDPAALAMEVTRASDFRRKHTNRTLEVVRRFIGNWYRMDTRSEPTPENLISNYIAFMLPETCSLRPEAQVTALRPVSHGEIANFMNMGITSWVKSSAWATVQPDIVRDMLLGYGVAKVGIEPRDSYTEAGDSYLSDRLVPFVSRVPPDHLILDPRCEVPELARFIGDMYWMDLDSLVNNPDRWDPEAVQKIKDWGETTGVEENAQQTERALSMGQSGPRRKVMLVDLWIPETGELVTLAQGDQKDCQDIILRRGKYEGPKCGPYEIFGCYRVPGDPYPISRLQFCMEQFEEMQAHANSVSEAAETYKRFVAVEAANVDAQNAVLTAKNGSVVPIRGMASGFQQVELGGPNAEQMQYVNILRDRFDRVLGLGDAQRGRAGGVTATESQIAQANVDGATGWIRSKVEFHSAAVLRKVGWYLFYNPTVAIEVSHTDPMTGQTTEGLFVGGVQPGQENVDWMSFNLEIKAGSMRQEDQQAALAWGLQLLQIAPQAIQLMMQMPMLNMRWIINQIGKAKGINNLADILVNQQALMQAGQLAAQQAAFGGMGDPGQLPGNLNPLLQQFLNNGNGGGNAGRESGWLPRPPSLNYQPNPQPMASVQPLFQPARPPFAGLQGLAPTIGGGPATGMAGMGMATPQQRRGTAPAKRPNPLQKVGV